MLRLPPVLRYMEPVWIVNGMEGNALVLRRIALTAVLVSTLSISFSGSALAHDGGSLDLPPGIARQASPLLEQMMRRMEEMDMSEPQMTMMMADMQAMAAELPPGIFLQLLQLMSALDMMEMMQLHEALHGGGTLLEQPPGQILRFVRELAA